MVNDERKYFIFNGKKSSDFDVWASGLNLMNSPEKRIERIAVPGRNGDLLIEDGSWANIELEFKDCFIPNDFSQRISDLSNYLNQQKGYQRLELSWIPDEYRLAAFHDGIETTLNGWNGYGKFDLTFNCKPQRFLKSGEEPIYIVPIVPVGTKNFTTPLYRLNQNTELDSITIGIDVNKYYDVLYTSTLVVRWYTDDSTYTESSTASALRPSPDWLTFEYEGDASELYGWKITIESAGNDFDLDKVDMRVFGIYETASGYVNFEGYFGRQITFENPTGFESRPLIKCYGASFPIDWIGDLEGEYWDISCSDYSETTTEVYIDCENEYLYYIDDGKKVNATSLITIDHMDGSDVLLPSFPVLKSGATTVYSYVMVANSQDALIEIYPRWYTI